VPRVALDLLDQQLLGLFGGETGDALQLALLLGDELLVACGRLFGALFASGKCRLAGLELAGGPLRRGVTLGNLPFAPDEVLFE
jgi:hypothetical protein